MNAFTRMAAVLAVVIAVAGCTRTIYVVQNPDGSFTPVKTKLTTPVVTGDTVIEDDGIVIEILTSTEYVLSDGNQPLHLQVTVEARDVEVTDRAPLNLAIVVDRSGSMRGHKISHAREAGRRLVDQLEDGDRVSIISYAGDVRVDVPTTVVNAHSRRALYRAIDSMRPGGQTFLSGGLRAGANEVMRALDGERINRVILLSDGKANVGTTDIGQLDRMAERFHRQGVTITTMGLGYDYNEDLMTALAVAGGGNYYYVERADALAQIFERELETLATVITRDMILYLELPDGVRLDQVYGYKHQQRGREIRVPLSSVSAGQKRRLLLSLDVPASSPGAQLVTNARVEYRNELKRAQRTLRLKPLAVTYTADKSRVARSVNRPVVEKLELVRNAHVRRLAMQKLDRGDRAGAAQVVRQRLKQSQRVHRAVGGAVIKRQITELKGLSSDVKAAPKPGSTPYKAMRKTRMREAYDFDQF